MKAEILFSKSEEVFLQQAYKLILGRPIDDSGLTSYLQQLLAGKDRIDILRDIYFSKEGSSFRNLSDLQGLDDEKFIDAVYHRLLGRAPDQVGKEHYLALIKRGKRKNVIPDIKASKEYKQRHKEQIELEKELLPLLKKASRKGIGGLIQGWGATKPQDAYQAWIEKYEQLSAQEKTYLAHRWLVNGQGSLISIVMPVSFQSGKHLDVALRSVKEQIYPHWQLLIVTDPMLDDGAKAIIRNHALGDSRIKLIYSAVDGDLTTALNTGLNHAEGRFVHFLTSSDQLAETSLLWVAEAIAAEPEAKLLYGDEDLIGEKNSRSRPYFKPDYNYELHLAQDLMGKACFYDSELLRRLGGFRHVAGEVIHWDATLRAVENLSERQIKHISRILYHKRQPGTGQEPEKASGVHTAIVEQHLQGRNISAQVVPAPEMPGCNRVIYTLPDPAPKVCIIVPTRDRGDLLERCVHSIRTKSTYTNYEILIIDNGSTEPGTQSLLRRLSYDGVRVERLDIPFNYSAINNFAARKTDAELLCFLNNDTEVITPGWLEELASIALQNGVGAVGARLWSPDGRLQHAGIITGIGGIAGHAHKGLARGDTGYFGRAVLHQDMSALTGACLMVKRSVFEQLSGFDEALPVSLNDVDLCLRLQQQGYRNVWTPYAELIHHEGASRGLDSEMHRRPRVAMEIMLFHARWGGRIFLDPAYNPNLSLENADFALANPPRVGKFGSVSSMALSRLAKEWFPALKEAALLASEPLMQENEQLRRTVNVKSQLVAQREAELAALHQAKEAVDKENEEILNNFLALQEDMEAVILDRREKENRLTELEQQKDRLEEERAGLVRAHEALQAERSALQRERDGLVGQLAQREAELAALHQAKEAVDKENEEILNNFLALQEDMEAVILDRREKENRLTELEQQKDRLEEERAGLVRAHEALQAERSALQRERDGLVGQLAQREAELAALHLANEALQAERSALQQERDGLAGQLAQREAQLAVLSKDRDEQAELAAQRQAELAVLHQALEQQKSVAAQLQAQLEQWAQQKTATDAVHEQEIAILKQRNTLLEEEGRTLKAQLTQAQQRIDQLVQELGQLKQDSTKETSRIDEQFNMIKEMLLREVMS